MSWTGIARRISGGPIPNRLGRRVWLLCVAAAATAICVGAGVAPGSRASYVIAGVGGAVALLVPWWLDRGSD
jgi:hypothetical protein